MNTYREILDLTTDEVRIHAPKEFVGHRVEVLIVELDNEAASDGGAEAGRSRFRPPFALETSNYQWNRDEAHER